MYFIGLDISKYKHDCFIVADSGEVIRQPFSFENNSEGFASLLDALSALDSPKNVKIGFEATSHYAENLKRFLVNHGFSFMEFNPLLLSKALKANSLRKTKTDKADAISIAHYLMSVVYKPNSISLYHIQSLKSLTRLRHSFVKQRSFFLVQLTNLLDLAFPEFKPFFGKKFSLTALFILEKYKTPKHIANMNLASYDALRCISKGKFSYAKFVALKALAISTVGFTSMSFEFQLISVLKLYNAVNNEISELERKISDSMSALDSKILSIKGIGIISASIIFSEYGDITNFSSPAQMLAFAGLEPGISQSGTQTFKGKMVKHGSPYLRFALINCANYSLIHNPILYDYYRKKRSEGKCHSVAITHVARKLVRIIFTLETKHIDFNPALVR